MLKKFLYPIIIIFAVAISIRPAAAKVSLMVLGDSLSAGYGISQADTWVAEVDRRWQQSFPQFTMINASISGETSGGGLNRLPDLLERHQPDMVFIELGGNDGLRGFSLSTLEDNLREMIEITQGHGICVALSEIEIPPNMGRRYANQFQQIFHSVADDTGVPLVPFFMRNIYDRPNMIQGDGIHPTQEAQPEIADILENTLTDLLIDCTER